MVGREGLEYKKFNGGEPGHRDIETLTEEELFAALDSSGYVRLSFRTKPLTDSSNKRSIAVSTDSDVPFVKNCVNSYSNSNNLNNNNKKKNIYNNYCETLKLDRRGEKENPFAGMS
ncbi:unnamed protein product [Oppiella nova]|uniref:Uncharacterized protein n=1 Tax=Oppiella nova TaxID=334625 RepID=A0A7R9QVZ6_9ACAR|nr:unnamed protein product [Oppiella nova]CAG2176025.1 unnamed protein product [Oppiella nova]